MQKMLQNLASRLLIIKGWNNINLFLSVSDMFRVRGIIIILSWDTIRSSIISSPSILQVQKIQY